jgi:hypothetical protein
MPSPFPGVDPFIEISGRWVGFHNMLIANCTALLNARLPDHYAAIPDERVELVDLSDGPSRRQRRPDIAVARELGATKDFRGSASAVATELAPTTVRLPDYDEIPEAYIEIVSVPDQELVTSIEILSPTNKSRADGGDYLAKRAAVLCRGVNLVEIDLLLGGDRLPAMDPLPPGDFYAFVSRRERRPESDVYAWSIRRPIPNIPIPLKAPDPDVVLDLATAFATTYDQGRYDRTLRYELPMLETRSAADREWAAETARLALRS